MVTTTTTVDSMVHREVVAMEATEVAAAVVAVEAVAGATAILSNNETTTITTKKIMLAGDLVALLITVTPTLLHTVVDGVEVHTLVTGDLGADNRVLMETGPSSETVINKKTLAFHEEALQLNTKLRVQAASIQRRASLVFSFQISLLTMVRKT